MPDIKFQLHYTSEQAKKTPYVTVPLTLPPNVRGVTVHQAVQQAEAVVDLGFTDAAGVRGWSGGARRSFTVTTSDATPGYLPGPFLPGEHAVLLGLYQVPAGGVDVTLTVNFHFEGPLKWYRGDLHTHTFHSDAAGSPATLAANARDRGLDFVVVADHNTVSHHAHLQDPLFLPAQEVTTYRGHFVAHGWGPLLDFRVTRPENLGNVLAEARQLRMITVLAHPVPTCPSCDWQWGHEEQFHALEVWNGAWLGLNWIARDKWLTLLDRGVRIAAVGGSDRHQGTDWPESEAPSRVGTPTTWLRAHSNHPGDLYAALLAGRTCISEQPTGPLIDLSLDDSLLKYKADGIPGGELVLYAGRAEIARLPFDRDLHGEITIAASPATYYRSEIVVPTPAEHLDLLAKQAPDWASSPEAAVTVRAMTGAVWR